MRHSTHRPFVSGALALVLLPALVTTGGAAGGHPLPPLKLSVTHVAAAACNGPCALRRGEPNVFRFTLQNTGRRTLEVAWEYSCSHYMRLSLALLPSEPQPTRILARESFGRRVVCTRNVPLGRTLRPGAKLQAVLRWELPRQLPVGQLLLRGQAVVTLIGRERSKDLPLQVEQRIAVE